MENKLEVKIWGTRGSLAAPYADRIQFGGNTSCVSVHWDAGTAIFDCGTGLHSLGMELLCTNPDVPQSQPANSGEDSRKWVETGLKEIHIFLSHLHLDHICALPFFPLLFRKDWKIHIYGHPAEEKSLRETIGCVIQPPFWPVTMDQVAAEIIWHELKPDMSVELPGNVKIRSFCANHGAGALLYRVERDEVVFVYGLDHELTEDCQAAYCEFVHGADLLLFDGMYTEEEYVYCKGFGHSVWMRGVELAEECQISTVCISHHDWKRTDEQLEILEGMAKDISERCVFAREGAVFLLTEK